MEVLYKAGKESVALVYIARFESGKYVEFVESLQPPFPRNEKWVLIVSTLFGCPVGCSICDAGTYYNGKLSKKEIFSQIDFLVGNRFPDRIVNVKKFKIQFARMGDPAFNMHIPDVLSEFGNYYEAPGFIPSISSVAPEGCDEFFDSIMDIKEKLYASGNFQMQFSIHSTSEEYRSKVIPVKKWNFIKISDYGERFFKTGDRKITLNFALSKGTPFEPEVILNHFDPEIFLIKLTPVNPTRSAVKKGLNWKMKIGDKDILRDKINSLKKNGYDIIESIGEIEENMIGSNCGQHLLDFLQKRNEHNSISYGYKIEGLI